MSIPKRMGPVPLGNDVRIEVTVSSALATALDVLVDLSGASRVAIVRQALVDYVRSTGVTLPGEADPVPTRRKIRIKKESND